jgi:hypothetical protein
LTADGIFISCLQGKFNGVDRATMVVCSRSAGGKEITVWRNRFGANLKQLAHFKEPAVLVK